MSIRECEKKNDFSDFFKIFQLLEIEKKKKKIYIYIYIYNNYNEKTKKKKISFGAEILNGLLPNCVFRKGIVLQYWILYCRDLGLKGKIVLQGQVLYRDIGSLASREVSCDTACWAHSRRAGTAWARARRAAGALARRWAAGWGVLGRARKGACARQASSSGAGARRRARQASGRCAGHGRALQQARARAGRVAWAWLGAGRAGWPGLCTRCTRLDFQTGLSTQYFS